MTAERCGQILALIRARKHGAPLPGSIEQQEGDMPDAMGGRFLLVGFDIINSVKFTVPLTGEAISAAGFAESESHELQASCL